MKTQNNVKACAMALVWSVCLCAVAQGYVRPHDEVTPKPTSDVAVATGDYDASWESLKQWECPEWFKDAKFGIWAHWGPQCYAEDGDWYARFMYYSGSGQYNWHVSHFGNPSTYGLKEMCRDWTAPQWDPEALVKLYYEAGARYFFTLGQHHDNFDLWNSPYQEWNSVNMGPGKDIVGGWAEACKKYGLPLGISMHGSHAWTWLEAAQDYDGNLTSADGAGQWWDGYDPQELYAQRHAHSSGWSNSGTIHSQWGWGNGASLPIAAYKMKFQNRVLQCINDYHPDMLYFDDTVLPFYGCDDAVGLNILKHFYNERAARTGAADVVAMGKILQDQHKQAMLWDVERGVPDRIQEKYWQTCTCIGSWHYDINVYNRGGYKSAQQVVDMLVDVVSKNGNLLLSIPVRGNGTIDDKERAVVAGIKAWMDVNSSSIYGTRPWKTFGEGPLAEAANPLNDQGFNESNNYSSSDVRYVEKDGVVYATIMRWPAAGEFTFKAFGITSPYYSGQVTSVRLLGAGDVPFRMTAQGLCVEVPAEHTNDIAPVFAVNFNDAGIDYEALRLLIQTVQAEADTYQPAFSSNTGKYTASAYEQITEALAQADAVSETAEADAIEQAFEALRAAYTHFVEEGKNSGGALGTHGRNLTTDRLTEATNFSRKGTSTTRFGTPLYWQVDNFTIPQTTDNGTKNGIDKYPGFSCLMLGVWEGEDAATSSDLSAARIYQKVTLPAGQYFFGATFESFNQLNDQVYIFATTELGATDVLPQQSLAYYPINLATAADGKFYGIEFTLEEEQDIYLGFQADLTRGSRRQEFRIQAVRLVDRNETSYDILQTADQPTASTYVDLTVGTLAEAAAFSATNMGSRYGRPAHWTVENYSISSGQGTRAGIDKYPGYNCLSLGTWNDLGSNAATADPTAARIYQQVTLQAGTYYFGAQYETRYNMDQTAYLFVSRELLSTADIPTQSVACHLMADVPATTNSLTLYGVVFTLPEETTVYLGWQADLKNAASQTQEFRARGVRLLRYDFVSDLTPTLLPQSTAFAATDMGSRYGTPVDWSVDNYSIPSSQGTRGGIDNYPGYNCLSLGIWDDRNRNEGDNALARIYKQVSLTAGEYYFGATYQTVYNFSSTAHFFAATELPENTAAIPTAPSTLASLPLNSIPYFGTNDRDEKYYITFTLDNDTDVYLGWQVDFTQNPAQQEFRVRNVQLTQLSAFEPDPDAINRPSAADPSAIDLTRPFQAYNLAGQQIAPVPVRGIVILRQDGKSQKRIQR